MLHWPARRVATDTLWSIAGQVLPGLIGLVAVPKLVAGLGNEGFGMVGLAWATIGYFSLFDLGLGRAVTKYAAEALAQRDDQRLAAVVWTSWLALAAVGAAVGAAGFALAELFVQRMHVSATGMASGVIAFRAIGAAVPFVVVAAGARGVLEAAGAFRLIAVARVPIGVLAFLGPVAILPLTKDAGIHVAVIGLTRVLAAFVFGGLALRRLPALRRRPVWSRRVLRSLLAYGSWVTVSNVISPLMATLDRFVVGGIISVAAVTFYVTPFELASRLLLFPAALGTVVFPRFVTAHLTAPGQAASLARGASRAIALVLLPFISAGILLAPEILLLWVGPEMAVKGSGVLGVLLIGMYVNGLAHVPFAQLQGAGAANVTALAHLAELPVYLVLLYALTYRLGVEGVAIAWSIRVTLDFAILSLVVNRRVGSNAAVLGCGGLLIGAALFWLAPFLVLTARVALATAISAGILALWWRGGGGANLRPMLGRRAPAPFPD